MRRVSEGGSILGFIVIGVVLAGLLVGGAYFINRQKPDQPVPVAQQPQEEKPAPEAEQKPGEQRQSESQTPQTTPQAGVTHELPATGSGDVIVPLLIIGSVTGLFASYLRSRRALLSL